ncbi:hypothetical protein J2T09_002337 [Neorhizobium huautlense]|uniref:Uncharacterized protein n=1 Tax=Neorhizobium huautlense TaxID=67774 RepID=A0ABT9PSZ7_9HYPH|nr:hypothetical protein [Neorhizobium huautlense]MDP9837585.1 hypothetical protein [Neorhizobium huautlense]
MSGFLPIVDILAGAATDRARAEWLSAVPHGVVYRDGPDIAAILNVAGFEAGHKYLCALTAQVSARRTDDGRFPQTVLMATEMARLLMWEAVKTAERSSPNE